MYVGEKCLHSFCCRWQMQLCTPLTLFEIFIFCPKIQLWFSEKIVDFFGENVVVLDFLAVDNFDFTRKIVKKIRVKNSWKCWGFVKIEFLDKNLTFRIVWTCIFIEYGREKEKRRASGKFYWTHVFCLLRCFCYYVFASFFHSCHGDKKSGILNVHWD